MDDRLEFIRTNINNMYPYQIDWDILQELLAIVEYAQEM